MYMKLHSDELSVKCDIPPLKWYVKDYEVQCGGVFHKVMTTSWEGSFLLGIDCGVNTSSQMNIDDISHLL